MARTRNTFTSDEYLAWLVEQIGIPRDAPSYTRVLNLMFSMEFVWLIGNDENRVEDGRDLRVEYLARSDVLPQDRRKVDCYETPVTFLEVLVALSRRIGFLVEQDTHFWAWQLMKNLELHRFNDGLASSDLRKVCRIIETVVWRTYNPDGSGGFFPLRRPKGDQRKVEIWDQMAAYINENRASFGL